MLKSKIHNATQVDLLECFGDKSSESGPSEFPVPLAERMRPRTLDEVVGQDEAIGPESAFGKILRNSNFAIPSVILCGPPGVGKTTIARVIAETSNYHFVRLSGVLDGVAELRKVVHEAEERKRQTGRPTLALVDELHRFNRAQQDAFLPHIESGLLTVIGQTTENVSFRLRSALLSRLRVIPLVPLEIETLQQLIARALGDTERGCGLWNLRIADDASALLAHMSLGDARRALNGLEWAAAFVRANNQTEITREVIDSAFGSQPAPFDQSGDYHYDCISAFIKSMRGSDPDAALYYMVRALDAGEDPLFLTRRMIIFASEDASCDPRALELAVNADRAVERVGMPEGRIPMAHAAVYLASCPKSNRPYKALRAMEKIVEENPALEIPKFLRNAPTELMKEMGNSVGYVYPHDTPDAWVPTHYLPEKLQGLIVYEPSERGVEQKIKARLDSLRQRRIAEVGEK